MPDQQERVAHSLEDIFFAAPLKFAFTEADYNNLMQSSASMKQPLKSVEKRVSVVREAYLNTEDDGVLTFDLELPNEPGIQVDEATFVVPREMPIQETLDAHTDDELEFKHVVVRIPPMPCARTLNCFFQYLCITKPAKKFAPEVLELSSERLADFNDCCYPEVHLDSLPASLLTLRLGMRDPLVDDCMSPECFVDCKINLSPEQNLASVCPRLVSLYLRGVDSTCPKLVLPPGLRQLELYFIRGVHEVEFTGDLLEDFTMSESDFEKLSLPTSVRKIHLSHFEYFLKLNIPFGVEWLSISNRGYLHRDLDSRAVTAKFANLDFYKLTTLILEEVLFFDLVVPSMVTTLKCRNKWYWPDPWCERVSFGDSIRELEISNSMQNVIAFPATAELISLKTMPNITVLEIPPECRELNLEDLPHLKKIVFTSCCQPFYIFLKKLPELESICSEGGAEVPYIPTPILDMCYEFGTKRSAYLELVKEEDPMQLIDKRIEWYGNSETSEGLYPQPNPFEDEP